MKKIFKLIGIIALVAIIGFSFAACEEKDDTPPPPETQPPSVTPPPFSDFQGTWKTTIGKYQPYSLVISDSIIKWNDKDNDYIQYTNVQLTSAINNNTSYKTNYPNGYTFTGTRSSSVEYPSANFGFIALSADKMSIYLGINNSTAFSSGTSNSGVIYTKQ